MRTIAGSIALVLALSAVGQSFTAFPALESLTRESDIIVVAALEGVENLPRTEEEVRYRVHPHKGTLRVEAVLWGDLHPGQRVAVTWRDVLPGTEPYVRGMYDAFMEQGVLPLWFITRDESGELHTSPTSLWPGAERARAEQVLRENRARVAPVRSAISDSERRFVLIGYRNASTSAVTLPGLAFANDQLTLGSPVMSLRLFCGKLPSPPEVLPADGSIVISSDVPAVTVPPMSDWGIKVDLEALFGQGYGSAPVLVVQFGCDDHSMDHRFIWTRYWALSPN